MCPIPDNVAWMSKDLGRHLGIWTDWVGGGAFTLSCKEWVGFPPAEIGGARVRGVEGYSVPGSQVHKPGAKGKAQGQLVSSGICSLWVFCHLNLCVPLILYLPSLPP